MLLLCAVIRVIRCYKMLMCYSVNVLQAVDDISDSSHDVTPSRSSSKVGDSSPCTLLAALACVMCRGESRKV